MCISIIYIHTIMKIVEYTETTIKDIINETRKVALIRKDHW